jgi:hypothetical protein
LETTRTATSHIGLVFFPPVIIRRCSCPSEVAMRDAGASYRLHTYQPTCSGNLLYVMPCDACWICASLEEPAHVRSLGSGPDRWTLEQIREYFAMDCMYCIASEGSEKEEKDGRRPFLARTPIFPARVLVT